MAASHGADCPAECCLYRRIGALGSRRSHPCLAISGGPRWSSVRYRPPSSIRKPGSSSRELGSPPELVVPTSARATTPCSRTTCVHGRLPWGFLPLRDVSSASPLDRRASQARLRSALSVSHALDGLLLAVPCRPVSSCCHVQASRSRGFLPRPSRATSSVVRPSAPLAPSPCRRLPDDASGLCVDLEVLIRAEIRSTRGGFSPGEYPRPLVRFAPSGFAPPVLGASLPLPPLGL